MNDNAIAAVGCNFPNGSFDLRGCIIDSSSVQGVGVSSRLWRKTDGAITAELCERLPSDYTYTQDHIDRIREKWSVSTEPELRMSQITRCFKLNKL